MASSRSTRAGHAPVFWPAVDLTHTRRRADTAPDVRRELEEYDQIDSELTMASPSTIIADADLAARAQALHRYLSQPFRTAEPHTATPAEWATAEEVRRHARSILSLG